MIDGFTIHNVDGTHSVDINEFIYPLHDFDVTVTERLNTGRQKPQDNGIWPTLNFRDFMEIHCEGDIFGTDSANYFTNRLALITAIFGAAGAVDLTNRKRGTLEINFSGSTEHWGCDFSVNAWSAPLQGLSPSRTPFAVTFVSPVPYFVGLSTSTKYAYA